MKQRLDWLISVDDHILEPPDLWVERMPAKLGDRVPHVERIDGADTWVFGDSQVTVLGVIACAQDHQSTYTMRPRNYEDLPPAYYDSSERIADMDADGVLASVCFPFVPRFCGQAFLEAKDHDLALECVRVYNDWFIDEWCGTVPGRQIPVVTLPLWDPKLAVEEIERCAAHGAKGIFFSENPYDLGTPSIHSDHWDPVFAAANETGMPLLAHLGSSSRPTTTSPDAPYQVAAVLTALNLSKLLVDWLFSGKLQRYPNLKLVMAEGGIGWIPWVLERAQWVCDVYEYARGKEWRQTNGRFDFVPDDPAKLPEDVYRLFADHFFGCFIKDDFGAAVIEKLGVGNVMIETDYPHSDSLWPNSIEQARKSLGHLSEDEQYAILRGNAERVFDFTPADLPSYA